MDTDLLTTREVAAMFRVSPITVNRWAREGKLTPAPSPGGHRRYSRAALEVFSQTRGTVPRQTPASVA
jgi:excisionase family DNA binding protein